MRKTYIVNEGRDSLGRTFVKVGGCGNFSVMKTFDCGQAFRFDPVSVEGYDVSFSGKALGRDVIFCEKSEYSEDKTVTIIGATADDYLNIWERYLSLDVDYEKIDRDIISAVPAGHDREEMQAAVSCASGIRILRQDPFEALISFIISQNNNIPRIKKIISAMCEKYGENGSFPTAEALVSAGEEGLFALRTGFRAGYIFDAAKKVLSGEVDLQYVMNCENYSDAADILCKIKGVGPKVSACALLFGFGKTEAFPIDVWIKRSLERHFPEGFDHTKLGKNAGIAQQYLFYYERYAGGETL